MNLSPNFTLAEFLPAGADPNSVPQDVLDNLTKLANELLEPCRAHLKVPIRVTSGWRPPAHNAAIGGASGSDHTVGRAADLQGMGGVWADTVRRIFTYFEARRYLPYGQLILEDHRGATGLPGKFWVHVAYVSPKHPGTNNDPNRLLHSPRPGVYQPWSPEAK